MSCGTFVGATRLQATGKATLLRIETTSHLMEVWSVVDESALRKGAAVYAQAQGDLVMLEWPGGRTLHALALRVPVRPRTPYTAGRWLLSRMLAFAAGMFAELHIVPMARRLGRRSQEVGSDPLGGVRAKNEEKRSM